MTLTSNWQEFPAKYAGPANDKPVVASAWNSNGTHWMLALPLGTKEAREKERKRNPDLENIDFLWPFQWRTFSDIELMSFECLDILGLTKEDPFWFNYHTQRPGMFPEYRNIVCQLLRNDILYFQSYTINSVLEDVPFYIHRDDFQKAFEYNRSYLEKEHCVVIQPVGLAYTEEYPQNRKK